MIVAASAAVVGREVAERLALRLQQRADVLVGRAFGGEPAAHEVLADLADLLRGHRPSGRARAHGTS